VSVVGLVVRISAFHADGPGSIPGRRILETDSTFRFRNATLTQFLSWSGRSYSSVGQSVGLINLRSAVRARVGVLLPLSWR
jgi:hypothetical protein